MNNDDNKMTYDGNGKYTKNYTVSHAVKNVELKIYSEGIWYGLEGNRNCTFNILSAGTITITFDTSDNSISVSGDVSVLHPGEVPVQRGVIVFPAAVPKGQSHPEIYDTGDA